MLNAKSNTIIEFYFAMHPFDENIIILLPICITLCQNISHDTTNFLWNIVKQKIYMAYIFV